MKKVTLIIEENKDGFWAQIKEYPNVFTYGTTMQNLEANAHIALKEYFKESSLDFPKSMNFDYVYDITEFFAVNDFINITKLAERSGMNPSLLRQYAKGIKYPGEKQILKIQKTIRDIGTELKKSKLTSGLKLNS